MKIRKALLAILMLVVIPASAYSATYSYILDYAEEEMEYYITPIPSRLQVSQSLADNIFIRELLIKTFGNSVAQEVTDLMRSEEVLDEYSETSEELDTFMDIIMVNVLGNELTDMDIQGFVRTFLQGDMEVRDVMDLDYYNPGGVDPDFFRPLDLSEMFIDPGSSKTTSSDDCVTQLLEKNPNLSLEELILMCAGGMGGGGGGFSAGSLPDVEDPCDEFLKNKKSGGGNPVVPPPQVGGSDVGVSVDPDPIGPDPTSPDGGIEFGKDPLEGKSAEEICEQIKMSMAKYSAGKPKKGKGKTVIKVQITAVDHNKGIKTKVTTTVDITERDQGFGYPKLGKEGYPAAGEVVLGDAEMTTTVTKQRLEHGSKPKVVSKKTEKLLGADSVYEQAKKKAKEATEKAAKENNAKGKTKDKSPPKPTPKSSDFNPNAEEIECSDSEKWLVGYAMCAGGGSDDCGDEAETGDPEDTYHPDNDTIGGKSSGGSTTTVSGAKKGKKTGKMTVGGSGIDACDCNGNVSHEFIESVSPYISVSPDFYSTLCGDPEGTFGWRGEEHMWYTDPIRDYDKLPLSEQFHKAYPNSTP